MIRAAELAVVIDAETKPAMDGIHQALGLIEGEVSRSFSGLANLGGAITDVLLISAAAGITAFGAALGVSIRSAMDAEKVQAQLQAVLKSTGQAAGVTAEQVNQLADKLSTMTPFEDEAIISAQSLLLTFTKIGKDVFPDATRVVLDMSQALGQDLSSSAIQLGKALQDPVEGVGALRRVGVNFSEDQKKMIENLVRTGDVLGAQRLILEELNREFGGSAEAAGKTLAGSLTILKTKLGNIAESIGGAVLPALSSFAGMLTEKLADPAVQAAIAAIAEKIGAFAMTVVDSFPKVVEWFQGVFGWLQENQGVVVAALAAIGAAIAAFVYTTVIPAIAAAITAAAPILAVVAAIAAVAYLLYEAWDSNFLGIRDSLTEVWKKLQPVFDTVRTWLEEKIPIAIQALTDFWNNTLLPALTAGWEWFQTNLVPVFEKIGELLSVVIGSAVSNLAELWSTTLLPAFQAVWEFLLNSIFPIFVEIGTFVGEAFMAAFQGLADLWVNVLQPALMVVWGVLNNYVFPVFQAIGNVISAVVNLALEVMAGLLQNVLIPAIQDVISWVGEKLQPVFNALGKFWNETILPLIRDLVSWFDEKLSPALKTLGDWVKRVVDFFNDLANKIRNLKLPDWLTPGSPTPLELGLRGISSAMRELTRAQLPEFSERLSLSPVQRTAGSLQDGGKAGLVIQNVSLGFRDTSLNADQFLRAMKEVEWLYG